MTVHVGGRKTVPMEYVEWVQSVADTGDMEAGTHDVAVSVKPAVADYSGAGTCVAPADSRIVRLCYEVWMTITIDHFLAPATTLNYGVYIDDPTGLVAANLILSGSWAVIGAQYASADITAATNPTAFALLNDGAAHTFYVFLWVDDASAGGHAQISVCNVKAGVGSRNNASASTSGTSVLRFDCDQKWVSTAGIITLGAGGSGVVGVAHWTTPDAAFAPASSATVYRLQSQKAASGIAWYYTSCLAFKSRLHYYLSMFAASVQTDFNYVGEVSFLLSDE